ncbi:hypothetical protein GCM10009539_18380 [Cryptosporangium japonicum]|uniref:Uncharacterized protein n=1 Tax=Cryptosporangium japonicum TaxID=80872 RepID=A0ABN0TYN5_9ACTN
MTLVLLALAGATPDEIADDYLMTFERMAERYAALGHPDVLGRVRRLLAEHGTTVEASLASTVAGLRMPDFLRDNGLPDAELAALRARLLS